MFAIAPLPSIAGYSHTFFCLDVSFVISNDIFMVYFKICACVHDTTNLETIRKDATSKAIDKILIGFSSKHSKVI